MTPEEEISNGKRYALPQHRRSYQAKRQRVFYTDEHPEVPKVRRASRQVEEDIVEEYLLTSRPQVAAHQLENEVTHSSRAPLKQHIPLDEEQEYGDIPTYRLNPHDIRDEDDWLDPYKGLDEQDDPDAPQTTKPRRVVRPKRVVSRVPTRLVDEDEEEEGFPETDKHSSHILVSPRRRQAVYDPSIRRARTQPLKLGSKVRRPYRSTSQQKAVSPLRPSTHKQKILTITAIIGIILVILLTANNILTSSTDQKYTFGVGTTNSYEQNTKSGNEDLSKDPHHLIIVPPETDRPAPPLYAHAAFLLDADTGTPLYAYNPFSHLPVLSTTKLMTALVAAEQGDPNQSITINDKIAHDINQLSPDSSVMVIKKGETYTLKDMLYGLMLVSGNDAAIVIAHAVSGSVDKFVGEMNKKAKELGLLDTQFKNPHGLLETGHYSSARDLAWLGKHSLSNPLVQEISNTYEYEITPNSKHAEHYMLNGNQFMWWYPGVTGGKPGWDAASNFVQVVSVERDGRHLIGAIIHSNDWWTDMRNLMNWGLNNFDWVSPRDAVNNGYTVPYAAGWGYFSNDKRENTIKTADQGRYYIATGYSIAGLINDYFDKNGGLKSFGFPKGPQNVDSDTEISQKFEKATIKCNLESQKCSKS